MKKSVIVVMFIFIGALMTSCAQPVSGASDYAVTERGLDPLAPSLPGHVLACAVPKQTVPVTGVRRTSYGYGCEGGPEHQCFIMDRSFTQTLAGIDQTFGIYPEHPESGVRWHDFHAMRFTFTQGGEARLKLAAVNEYLNGKKEERVVLVSGSGTYTIFFYEKAGSYSFNLQNPDGFIRFMLEGASEWDWSVVQDLQLLRCK